MAMSLKEKQALLKNIVKKTQDKNGGSKHVLAFAGDRIDELKHKFIPTPSQNINMAIGDGKVPGGIVRGRITEIAGESGSGKTSLMLETIAMDHKNNAESIWGWLETEGCLSENALLFDPTTGVHLTAKELFESQKPFNVLSFNEATRQNEVKPITHYFDNGVKEVFRVSTSTAEIELTANHEVLTHTYRGQLEWKRVDELSAGDYVLRPKVNNLESNGSDFTDEQMRLIGYMLGDGCSVQTSLSFTNIDEDVIRDFTNCVEAFGCTVVKRDDRHYGICGEETQNGGYAKNPIRDFLKELGIDQKRSIEKFIPEQVFSQSNEKVAQLISALWMTDGCISNPAKRLSADYSTNSKRLALQIIHLLSRFGIVGQLRAHHYDNPNHNTTYRVYINGYDQLVKFHENIMLLSSKQERLLQAVQQDKKQYHPSRLGHYFPDYEYKRHKNVREKFLNDTDAYFVEVLDIESIGEMQTYDFTVEDNHNFYVNDILVHNSFDWDYAQEKGIDPDRLVLWEVDDTGAESGLDTLEMLVRSQTLTGVVINSVSGLTPKKELESEMEKQDIALLARMLSKLMRKITAIAHRTETAVIFINQYRTNVGQLYGNPDVTTGGRALQFFSTQRIGLRKVKIQKEDGITEEEGIKVNVRVAKNRIARDNPYKATSYTALYGHGIDDIREIAQIAMDLGMVDVRGSWIYYPNKEDVMEWNGEKMAFQSKAKFLDFIRNQPDFKAHLQNIMAGKAAVGSIPAEEIALIEAEEAALANEMGDVSQAELELDSTI